MDRATAEVALHGFSREQCGSAPSGKPSDFFGLALTDQLDLIERGALRLKEVFGDRISGFVPPWNGFGAVTLDTLEKLHFRYLSGGWEVPLAYHGDVAILPRTYGLRTLEIAAKEARRARRLSPLIIAVMHHYDFAESGSEEATIDLSAFDRLLGWLMEQPDLSVSPLRNVVAELTGPECHRALKRHRLRSALHWRLQKYVPQHSLSTAPLWRLLVP